MRLRIWGADPSRLHQLGHRPNHLGDRDLWVKAVQVLEVDMVGAEPEETFIDTAMNGGRRTIDAAPLTVDDNAHLASQRVLVPPAAQSLGNQAFVVSQAIEVGSIEVVAAQLQRPVEKPYRVCFGRR